MLVLFNCFGSDFRSSFVKLNEILMIEHENNPQSSDRANNNPKSDVGKFREKNLHR
jgi:hypothetical protein